MCLVHKSIDVRPEVWRILRVNAELSGVALRDYLTFLIERSSPIETSNAAMQSDLQAAIERNQQARFPMASKRKD